MMIREGEQVVRPVKWSDDADEAENLPKLRETVEELDNKVLLGMPGDNRAFNLVFLWARASNLN